MPKFDFNAFFKELKDGVKDIAKEEAIGFVKEASGAGKDFLDTAKADLKKWTKQLAQKKLSKGDFKFLVEGKTDLAKIEALKEAGFAAIRIDRIKVAVIDLIITTAGKMV